MCAQHWFTDSWLEHAFSDTGADLSPADYDCEGYFADTVIEEEAKLNSEMEKFCAQFD